MSLELTSSPPRSWAARLPFYYGWVILPIAALAMTGTLPGRTHGIGLIQKPLLADLSITELAFAGMNFWSIIIGSVICWPVGKLMDRYGTRGVLVVVTATLGAVVIATGRVEGTLGLFVALIFTRGLGQGALSVISTAMLGKWFSRRVGFVMGVYAVMLAIGFIGSVLGVGAAVEQVGWRTAWAGVGYALLFGLAPLSLLFAVSTPESCGLRIEQENDDEAKNDRADLTLKNALTSSAFWVFSSASCLFGFMWSAITLFHESILASRGFDQHDFVKVMGIVTAVGFLANLLGAWLATRYPLGRVLGVGMLLLAAALVLFPFVTSHTLLFTYAIFFGISSGLVTVVHFAFHPQAFGRTHLGQIQGVFQVLSVFTSALGPLILAWCKDRFGTYEVLFFVVTPLSLILAAAAIFVPLPMRPLLNSTEGSSS